MFQRNSTASMFTLVILLGIVFQVAFIRADRQDSPGRAVTEFSKAYFGLDKSMADRICSKQLAEGYIVENYIERKAAEAQERGFRLSYAKNKLYHIRTHTLSTDEFTQAKVRLTAERKPFIRSLFTGESYEVDQVFDVVNENGKWKVCGNIFAGTEG